MVRATPSRGWPEGRRTRRNRIASIPNSVFLIINMIEYYALGFSSSESRSRRPHFIIHTCWFWVRATAKHWRMTCWVERIGVETDNVISLIQLRLSKTESMRFRSLVFVTSCSSFVASLSTSIGSLSNFWKATRFALVKFQQRPICCEKTHDSIISTNYTELLYSIYPSKSLGLNTGRSNPTCQRQILKIVYRWSLSVKASSTFTPVYKRLAEHFLVDCPTQLICTRIFICCLLCSMTKLKEHSREIC